MPDQSSANFAAAYKDLKKAADANPEWFDRARDVLKRSDTGSVLLMHALMDGLREAYEAGQAGKGLPPLKHVQPGRNRPGSGKEWREVEAEPAPRRATRPAPQPAAPAAPVKRVQRGAR